MPVSRRSSRTALAAALLALAPPAAAQEVDYLRDVQPILERSCYDCHGPDEQWGGLRLDLQHFAAAGGASGGTVLGGPLEENELYRRITAEDDEERMPQGGRLAPEEIDVLRRWIEAGSPWSAPAAPLQRLPEAEEPRRPSPLDALALTVERQPYVLLGILALAFLIERRKRTQARAGRNGALVRRIGLSHYLGAVLVACVAALLTEVQDPAPSLSEFGNPHNQTARREALFGDPPVPVRTHGQRGIRSTYYRGNCERAPHQFNGGNYRTCTFHVDLCDRNRRPVQIGEPVPEGGYFLRLEIARAPNTAAAMFNPTTMASTFLTEEYLRGPVAEVPGRFSLLETLERDWRWVAHYPIELRSEPGWTEPLDSAGTVYVYTGHDPTQDFLPRLFYGIRYELAFEKGRLAEGSEIFIGDLSLNGKVELPQREGQVPQAEWLGTEPVPVIPDDPEPR